MRIQKAVAISLLFCVASLANATASTARSPMDPHPPAKSGSWFEGWYTRVTDSENGVSFAVIGSSIIPRTNRTFQIDEATSPLAGYLAVLVDRAPGTRLEVIEEFPKDTFIRRQKSEPVFAFADASDFEWTAGNIARMSADSIDVSLPGRITLSADFSRRIAWKTLFGGDFGPEGLAGLVPFLPLHWYVYSLGSEARYEIKLADGTTFSGTGWAHQEKNWGLAFPKAWVWAQGVNRDNTSHIALAGGKVAIGRASRGSTRSYSLEKWMLGFDSPKHHLAFGPANATVRYQAHKSARDGKLHLTVKSLRHRLEIDAVAPPESFGPVSIPTESGFTTGGVESFSTSLRVELFSPPTSTRPEETAVFENAALEFGADWSAGIP